MKVRVIECSLKTKDVSTRIPFKLGAHVLRRVPLAELTVTVEAQDGSREIGRSSDLGIPGGFCAGASTDHLERVETTTQLVDGVCVQIESIRSAGGVPVILPMPLLPALGTDARGYVEVYGDIVRSSSDGR